jgi:hypothetical protein
MVRDQRSSRASIEAHIRSSWCRRSDDGISGALRPPRNLCLDDARRITVIQYV